LTLWKPFAYPIRQQEVRSFLDSILKDVSLMIQLTPESMEVLNATMRPLDGVRFVSYAPKAPAPSKIIDRARGRLVFARGEVQPRFIRAAMATIVRACWCARCE
jgi:hypothetical protein